MRADFRASLCIGHKPGLVQEEGRLLLSLKGWHVNRRVALSLHHGLCNLDISMHGGCQVLLSVIDLLALNAFVQLLFVHHADLEARPVSHVPYDATVLSGLFSTDLVCRGLGPTLAVLHLFEGSWWRSAAILSLSELILSREKQLVLVHR